jgi:hypothetical protein
MDEPELLALLHRRGCSLRAVCLAGVCRIAPAEARRAETRRGVSDDRARRHRALDPDRRRTARRGALGLHHHESYDGTGYPEARRAAESPLESRIIAVADAFEAMTGSRPYRDSISVDQALEELQAHIGTQFDARCVQALIDVVNDGVAEVAVPVPAPRWGDAVTNTAPALRTV